MAHSISAGTSLRPSSVAMPVLLRRAPLSADSRGRGQFTPAPSAVRARDQTKPIRSISPAPRNSYKLGVNFYKFGLGAGRGSFPFQPVPARTLHPGIQFFSNTCIGRNGIRGSGQEGAEDPEKTGLDYDYG